MKMFMVIDLFICHNFRLCLGLGPRGPLAVLPLNVKLPCPRLDTVLASTVTVEISISSVFLAVEIHTCTLTWQSISKFKKLYLLICVATCIIFVLVNSVLNGKLRVRFIIYVKEENI